MNLPTDQFTIVSGPTASQWGDRYLAKTTCGHMVILEMIPVSSEPQRQAVLSRIETVNRIRSLHHMHTERFIDVRWSTDACCLISCQRKEISLQQCATEGRSFPLQRTIKVIHGVADALRAAAYIGLVHGNISSNCIYTAGGAPATIRGIGELYGIDGPYCHAFGFPHRVALISRFLSPHRTPDCGLRPCVACDVYALMIALCCSALGRMPHRCSSGYITEQRIPHRVFETVRHAESVPHGEPGMHAWDAVVKDLRACVSGDL